MAYQANTRKRQQTKYIAVHCSATRPSQDVGAEWLDRVHRKLGWLCIGYHYVIQRDGTLEEGREENRIGSHVEGYNSISIGICLIGGVQENNVNKGENNFTDEQFKTLELLLKHLQVKYPEATIQGHRDFPNVAKECPCFDVATWLRTVKIDNPQQ